MIEKKNMNNLIQEAIDNNFYGLNAEDFFVQKILEPIESSRMNKRVRSPVDDRELLRLYFNKIAKKLIPTENIIKKLEFLKEEINSDLRSEILNHADKIFSEKFLLWIINNSSKKLAETLSIAMTKKINTNKYSLKEVINNIGILTNEVNKDIFLSEIFLVENLDNYVLLSKLIKIKDIIKSKINENILIKGNDSMLLIKDDLKKLITEVIKNKKWKKLETYIKRLNVNKINYLIDIITESNSEPENKKQYDIAIYKIIDRAIILKKEDLINRIIELKKEKPEITELDIYVLIVRRIYGSVKREQSQEFMKKIMEVAKENNDLIELKNILFSSVSKYPIHNLNLELNLDDTYFKNEMKLCLFNYLEENLTSKKIIQKTRKI